MKHLMKRVVQHCKWPETSHSNAVSAPRETCHINSRSVLRTKAGNMAHVSSADGEREECLTCLVAVHGTAMRRVLRPKRSWLLGHPPLDQMPLRKCFASRSGERSVVMSGELLNFVAGVLAE